ncbi:MAG: hypothetical protein ACREAE_05825 [Nitrosopumilaceae archaeon]
MNQTKTDHGRKQGLVEALAVFGVMTGILLPVRLFFYTHVSTDWFGSFGLISVISVIMVVLVKKKKVGRFGAMFENQMYKMQHGKRGMLAYGQSTIILLLLGGTIFAIELGNSTYSDIKAQILQEVEGIDEPEKMMLSQIKDHTIEDWIKGLWGIVLAIFFAFPQLSALLAVLNDTFDGWILHFYTVGLVETMEVFGILIFYRFTLKNKRITVR